MNLGQNLPKRGKKVTSGKSQVMTSQTVLPFVIAHPSVFDRLKYYG
jgi:hypothetical protein